MRAPELVAPSSVTSSPAIAGIELSGDPAFARRVVRLGFTSVVALGVIYELARFTTDASPAVEASLAAGWVLMPAILFASLRLPALRYALVVPSTLVTLSLLAITTLAFDSSFVQALGWLLITAGVLLGGFLGVWFWYRWLPVPIHLDDPFSRGRWMFICVHVMLIVAGLIIVSSAALLQV